MKIINEETYLAINSAGRGNIGDAALHHNRGRNSEKVWRSIVARQAARSREVVARRDVLRQEYAGKVAAGELRPQTRLERLQEAAGGHPDLESVQAARRLLAKRAARMQASTEQQQ